MYANYVVQVAENKTVDMMVSVVVGVSDANVVTKKVMVVEREGESENKWWDLVCSEQISRFVCVIFNSYTKSRIKNYTF